MAAPTHTAKTAPSGKMLEEGFPCSLMFARFPNIALWPKGFTPPGADGGDAIDITTQVNVRVKTKAARTLYMSPDLKLTVAFDPKTLYQCTNSMINQEGSCTFYWPDGSYLDFYGYLQKFEPKELKEGEHPEADVTVVMTNWDPVNKIEVEPVFTEVTGT